MLSTGVLARKRLIRPSKHKSKGFVGKRGQEYVKKRGVWKFTGETGVQRVEFSRDRGR